MALKHSLVPLDHFTTGLSEEDLRGLAERHEVTFEVRPHQVVLKGEVQNRGWQIDLLGCESPADADLPREEAHHHVHDVLHALARAGLPTVDTGPIDVDLERWNGSVYLEPNNQLREVIRLRIVVEPEIAARISLVGGATDLFKDEIRERLCALGARPR